MRFIIFVPFFLFASSIFQAFQSIDTQHEMFRFSGGLKSDGYAWEKKGKINLETQVSVGYLK